ncbi:MAG: DNA gyrase modulator, partial [Candidatus Korobacteraceae bacterium]
MLTRDHAAEIFDKLRGLSSADEVELLISSGNSALTRFANNTIHQNVSEDNIQISVRVSFGGRTARATTNKSDDDSLHRVVQSAEALASVQQDDADLLPMPSPEEAKSSVASPSRHFENTARLTPQDRAAAVAQMVDVAKKNRLTTAGVYSSSEVVEGLFNSRGVAHWYEQTLAEVSITMLADNSSGWQKANSPDARQVDHVRMAEVAAQKAID